MISKIASTIVINTLKGVMTNSTIPRAMDNTQETISKLKFIGRIKKGDKINTKHMYVQPSGFGTSISRTFFNQDNRGNALSYCQETVNRSFELIISYQRSSSEADKAIFNNIIEDLNNSMGGIANLKTTYITDTKFCCDMDTLLQSISAKINIYNANKITVLSTKNIDTKDTDTLNPTWMEEEQIL